MKIPYWRVAHKQQSLVRNNAEPFTAIVHDEKARLRWRLRLHPVHQRWYVLDSATGILRFWYGILVLS